MLHFGQMLLNLPRGAVFKEVKDGIVQIYFFITVLLKQIKKLSTWLSSISLGNEVESPADLCLMALHTSGATLAETTVCVSFYLCRTEAASEQGCRAENPLSPGSLPTAFGLRLSTSLRANWWRLGSAGPCWCQMLASSWLRSKVIKWAECPAWRGGQGNWCPKG